MSTHHQSTLERLRRRGAGAEVVIALAAGAVVIGSGSGGGDSPLLSPLLPTLGSMEAEDSVEQADDGEVAPCKKFRGEGSTFDIRTSQSNINASTINEGGCYCRYENGYMYRYS